tara:strand:+ start:370 stop:516 length:147 start_codon:yes stop_codon:yes gene_type:complete
VWVAVEEGEEEKEEELVAVSVVVSDSDEAACIEGEKDVTYALPAEDEE